MSRFSSVRANRLQRSALILGLVCVGLEAVGCSGYRVEWGRARPGAQLAGSSPVGESETQPSSRDPGTAYASWQSLHLDLVRATQLLQVGDEISTTRLASCVAALDELAALYPEADRFIEPRASYERLAAKPRVDSKTATLHALERIAQHVKAKS
ncbi:MAG: hypothetical protein ACKVX7_01315 [Planctomycetota bacterium]